MIALMVPDKKKQFNVSDGCIFNKTVSGHLVPGYDVTDYDHISNKDSDSYIA